MTLNIAVHARRALAAAFIASGAAFGMSAPALADDAAEAFVREILVEANAVFDETDEAARLTGVENLVEKYVDMRRVGMFVLGPYARQISDAQKDAYFPLFRTYATTVYQDVLSNYSGEKLEVIGSVDRSERDIIVNSKVIGAKSSSQFADLVVHWRVYRGEDGAMSIFDAGADGVWLAIEQQSQFKSVIANNGGGSGGIDALISDLRDKVGE